jgi:hypothetical protein
VSQGQKPGLKIEKHGSQKHGAQTPNANAKHCAPGRKNCNQNEMNKVSVFYSLVKKKN